MADYIGGTTNLARITYYKKNPELLSSFLEISLRYNLDPYLLARRVANEGIVDRKIKDYNAGRKSEPINGTNLDLADEAFQGFGTDWLASRLKSGNVKLNRVVPFRTNIAINEKGETVTPPSFFTNYDNLEGVAAQLLKILQEVNQDFKDLNIDRHAAIMAYYNGGRGNGRKWIKDNSYLKYKLPQEYTGLFDNITPSKTPVINYADSPIFQLYYNDLSQDKWYPIPIMLQKPKQIWDLTPNIETELERNYINSLKDKEFKNKLGISLNLADSIMNNNSKSTLNYLNFFK